MKDCLKDCWAACCRRNTLSKLTIEQVWLYQSASRKTGRGIVVTPTDVEGYFDVMLETWCPLLNGKICMAKGNPLRAKDCTTMQPGDSNCEDSILRNPKV